MTPLPALVLVACSALLAHIIASTSVAAAHAELRLPPMLRLVLTDRVKRRTGRWRWADIPVALAIIIPTQLVMVEAIVHSSRVSGDIGAVIGAVELLLAAGWTGLLWREVRRSRRAHPS